MCATCGCGDVDGTRVRRVDGSADPYAGPVVRDHVHPHAHPGPHEHGPAHAHPHAHPHGNDHEAAERRTISLEQQILAKNDDLAARNRSWLREHDIVAVNLMSSPGAGKTTLLERTARELGSQRAMSVIEGDQETTLDADRIRASGCAVVQINTGAGCHLDADMLARGIRALEPGDGSLLVVENVGNLVCPALFDLGELGRAVVISVTEGDDKPVKYPNMFAQADLVVVNKVDLLPYVDFDVDRCAEHARRVNPGVDVLTVSATRGDGLDGWYAWLQSPTASRSTGSAG